MGAKRLFLVLANAVLICSMALGQTPTAGEKGKGDEAEAKKEAKQKAIGLLNELIKEAQALKLPDNRIRIQAKIADALWPQDEARARALMKAAISALGELATEGRTRREFVEEDIHSLLRMEILEVLKRRDTRLAREFLQGTKQKGESELDIGLELEVASQVAAGDPKEAFKIAEGVLRSGAPLAQPDMMISLLVDLRSRDPETAAKLASEMVKFLRSTNLSENAGAANLAVGLLRLKTRPHEFARPEGKGAASTGGNTEIIDEQTMRELVGIVVAAALNDSTGAESTAEDFDSTPQDQLLNVLYDLLPEVERYAPGQAQQLRTRAQEAYKQLPPRVRWWREFERVAETGTAQALIEAAKNAPEDAREMLFQLAVRKALDAGDAELARRMAQQNAPDDDSREAALEQIERVEIEKAADNGKVDQARQVLTRLGSDEERAVALMKLAEAASVRGDRKTALELIGEARSLISTEAGDFMQFNLALALARRYRRVGLPESFNIINSTTEQVNALVAAAAVLDSFEGRRQFREGEMILREASSVGTAVRVWSETLRVLARSSLEQALSVADKLARPEVRLVARLSVAKGALGEESADDDLPEFAPMMFPRRGISFRSAKYFTTVIR